MLCLRYLVGGETAGPSQNCRTRRLCHAISCMHYHTRVHTSHTPCYLMHAYYYRLCHRPYSDAFPDWASVMGKANGSPVCISMSEDEAFGVLRPGDAVWSGVLPLEDAMRGDADGGKERAVSVSEMKRGMAMCLPGFGHRVHVSPPRNACLNPSPSPRWP